MTVNDDNHTENEYESARELTGQSADELPYEDESLEDASTGDPDVNDLSTLEGFDSFGSDLDIDAALAALTTLPDVMAEREAQDTAERARLAALKADEEERKEAERIAAEEYALWLESYHLPAPPPVKMLRGRIQSVVPALLLMASGAYLTFSLTFSETPPAPAFVILILCGVIGVSLLAYWLASERWSRGALFSGLTLLFGGVTLYYTLQEGAVSGWELLVLAVGAAVFLSGLLARPVSGRVTAVGLAFLAAGGFIIVTANDGANGFIDTTLLPLLTTIAPFILLAYAVLMILPLIFRRTHAAHRTDANRS